MEGVAKQAKIKGIDLVGTGDFTHPGWLCELKDCLKPASYGIYGYKDVNFILTTEISCIYSQAGKVRKIHIIVFAPDFETAEKINRKLSRIGNLKSDGRPILGLAARELVEIVLSCSERCFVVPAHVWTPWFSLFGANSGFDDINECFGDMTEYIYALETGLSSDPRMNWTLSALDKYVLISNSDAHSPSKLGREANVFDCRMDYAEITGAIKEKDRSRFIETLEFFPGEGKYHYDGHRKCGVSFSPEESKKNRLICPVCGKKVTVGVLHRVSELADRKEGFKPPGAVPFRYVIPLREIIGDCLKIGSESEGVRKVYDAFIQKFGNEFNVLLNVPAEDLLRVHARTAQAVINMREKKVNISPGYDGVYGKIDLEGKKGKEERQMELF